MRTCKKIIFIVIALLPVICVAGQLLGAITNENFSMNVGSVEFTSASDGFILTTTPDSWASLILDPVFSQNAATGFFESFFGFYQTLNTSIGLPINLYTVASGLLILYYFWVFFISWIVDFLTFVPRKCLEFFQ